MTKRDTCPKCTGATEPGFIVDSGLLGAPSQSKWVQGEPKHSWQVPGVAMFSNRITVITYRCRECGFLESYAGDEV